MFKRFFSLILLLTIALSLAACAQINIGGGLGIVQGSGKVAKETRQVSDFSGVLITGSGEAIIAAGDANSLVIEAEDNILPLIDSTVQDNQLVISLKPGASFSSTQPIRYTITARNLTGVALSGSGSAAVRPVKGETLVVSTSGSGSIKMDELQAKSLRATTSGSGSIEVLAGKVDALSVTSLGSGSFTGESLQCGTAQAITSGSGSITVWVKDSLVARTAGSGNIEYYGQPAVTRTESGSGRVNSLGNK